MDRNDFVEQIEDYADLINFCNDNEIYSESITDCTYDYSDFCDAVDDDIRESVRWDRWEDIRDWLNQLPTGSDTGYYRRNGRLDYEELTSDDFEYEKQCVLEIAEEEGFFEEEASVAERYAQEEMERERIAQEAARKELEADAKTCAALENFLGEEMIA